MIQNLNPILTVGELNSLLAHTFPQAFNQSQTFFITDVFNGGVVLQLSPQESHLRHGGTISGPTLFALADIAGYAAILAHVGHVTSTVTSNMTINFLSKPEFAPVIARATILRLGRQNVVTQTSLHALVDDALVAHATATYAVPLAKK